MKRSEPSREANIWVARGVPVFLLGILGYASWVMTKVLCIDYLLQRPLSSVTKPHPEAAVTILVIYYILLFIMLVCYARLIYVVTRCPGLVPRGPLWHEKHTSKHRSHHRRHRDIVEKPEYLESELPDNRPAMETVSNRIATDAKIKVEDFWKKDVFTCGHDGRPAFCSTCYNWKPDRAHHCSELDRCVLKMDHFCPWVAGVVGETSFKYFIQFTFWAALLCTHILVSIAYYFAERNRLEGTLDVHWTVILGVSGLFLLFSAGMCMSSLQFAFINSTTIENLSRKQKVWYLAVHVPEHLLEEIEQRGRSNLRLITYPRPQAEQFQILERSGAELSPATLKDEPLLENTTQPLPASRTFAILETTPGTNPFDLGPRQNFTDVMGSNLFEWLLPVRPSPSVRHESTESFYKMGAVVDQLKHEARIMERVVSSPHQRRRSRRRSKQSSSRSRAGTSHDS